ncbi:MAG: 50S ribosomal protein L25 [Deltaproteobacteria bacterium]|nr:50S ribosomal protein L25 [Deltaproteobacteria bacterium]
MERATLQATTRTLGKGPSRRLRTAGTIPAILYGKGREPTPLAVAAREMEGLVHTAAGMNVLIDLSINGGETVVARIRDYQADSIRRVFTHVDFQTLDLTQKIMVEVPIRFEGKSEGVKLGGILTISRRTIEVRCLPTAVPEAIGVDIGGLQIGQGIHVNDLQLPSGVEIPPHVNYAVVSVVAPMKEEEVAAPVEAAVPAEGVAPVPAVGEAPAAETKEKTKEKEKA